ncbi:hypothetical protein EF918_34115, partial [Streptomyces sp. WAC06614]
MHDTRIRQIASRATQDGRRGVTLTQLWYLSRTYNGASGPRPASGVPARVRWLVAAPVAAALATAAVSAGGFLASVCGLAGLAVVVTAARMDHFPAAAGWSRVVPAESTFRRLMRDRWLPVYGALPEGVVDDLDRAGPQAVHVSAARSVILCADHAVAVHLAVSTLPERLRASLVEVPADATSEGVRDALAGVPADLPVVVLHDAGLSGVLLAPLVRALYPDRTVVDGGLRPRLVMHRNGAVRLYSPVPDEGLDVARLRAVAGLTESEADWLARGLRSPIAAVPPVVLRAAVERAVRRATGAPGTRAGGGRPRDRGQGFLTWPGPPVASPTGPATGSPTGSPISSA